MLVKFIQYWNVLSGKEKKFDTFLQKNYIKGYFQFNQYFDMIYDRLDEYTEFIVKEHMPALEGVGIHMGGEWEVSIGAGPNLIVEGHCESLRQLFGALSSLQYSQSID